MADVVFFVFGLISGVAGGLVFKKSGLKIIPQ
jgi:hypothetical protein